MQEKVGVIAGKPMTRDEALKILNIEEAEAVDASGAKAVNIKPEEIMKRFDILIEKNQPDKGGSFYLQSKIYFAKQHLMKDFPEELNLSEWNPEGAGKKAMDKEEEDMAENKEGDDKSEKK